MIGAGHADGCSRVLTRCFAGVKGRTFHDSRECGPIYRGRGTSVYEGATEAFVMPEALVKRLAGLQLKEHQESRF